MVNVDDLNESIVRFGNAAESLHGVKDVYNKLDQMTEATMERFNQIEKDFLEKSAEIAGRQENTEVETRNILMNTTNLCTEQEKHIKENEFFLKNSFRDMELSIREQLDTNSKNIGNEIKMFITEAEKTISNNQVQQLETINKGIRLLNIWGGVILAGVLVVAVVMFIK
ncbi:hypothetical protein [Anaerobium acetethylicum]|uniref:Uncharacterized protein n=1 Tax=Anaerobium acetethylicum TaxID=1619234 RepID=A0A1D3TXQ7_9FIRM|nr:hypothetical protein [Anaerobium acetethylicum]SCP99124.1 hypothetical protein SAMN05421730_10332 [Anaerobium acetethylicum]